MKKLLVFSDGHISERQQLEDYLYDSEVTRDDFIDMNPSDELSITTSGIAVNVTSWPVVFKGDDKYDQWHFLVVHEDTYAFDEIKHVAALNLMKPYHSEHVRVIAVSHSSGHLVFIYRIAHALSKLIGEHIDKLLESFNGKEYTYQIPEVLLGSVHTSISEDEAS